MNYNIEINTDTIYEFSKDIEREGNIFLEKLDKFLERTKRMEECFDTETGKMLKDRLIELINNDKALVNNKYIPYSKTIKNIADIYETTKEEIKSSME